MFYCTNYNNFPNWFMLIFLWVFINTLIINLQRRDILIFFGWIYLSSYNNSNFGFKFYFRFILKNYVFLVKINETNLRYKNINRINSIRAWSMKDLRVWNYLHKWKGNLLYVYPPSGAWLTNNARVFAKPRFKWFCRDLRLTLFAV